MAADPALVVLDEATASVDSITEARIQAATAEILARKTAPPLPFCEWSSSERTC